MIETASIKEIDTGFCYCDKGDDKGFFSSNEQRWITHIKRLAEKHPDKCVILSQPEDNDGVIYARMPTSWLYIRPPVKREMTDEQRAESAERLRLARQRAKE